MVKKTDQNTENSNVNTQENMDQPKAHNPKSEPDNVNTAEEEQEEPEQKEEKKGKASQKKSKKEKVVKLEEKISDQEKKIDELHDKYIRLSAEFDNYRRRTLREKSELLKTAGEDLLVKLLPVMDDFERAIGSLEESEDVEAVKAGLHLIYSKFKEFLKQQGVQEMNSKDKEFDTDRHEAISKIPSPDADLKGKIVDVLEKGYFLNDKVIRYAKVIIGE